MNVINLADDVLTLYLPRGDFTDTLIEGLNVSTSAGSTAGNVRVAPWTHARIASWHAQEIRWNRYGRHIARLIGALGYSPSARGLVQRAVRRVGVPLARPPKTTCLVANCRFDTAGWAA